MDHVGIVVDDLEAATEFFVELGLEPQGDGEVEGRWVDRVVGLDGVHAALAMLQTPDDDGRLELVKFHSPPAQGENGNAPANARGIRHISPRGSSSSWRSGSASQQGETQGARPVGQLATVPDEAGV